MKRKPIKCFYCNEDTFINRRLPDGSPHPQMRTKDHLHPKAKGGGTIGMGCFPNTVLCCYGCNQEKGSMGYLEFLQHRGVITKERKAIHA